MEPPQHRDINDLLVNGYFKTSRARSPAGSIPTSNSPSFLTATEHATPRHRTRSRSRGPSGPPPPRPTVEDEEVSLSRESDTSSVTSYDPPLRGIIEQNPIILEAEISSAEAARLQTAPSSREQDENPERRFVFIPKSDSGSGQEDSHTRRDQGHDGKPKEDRRKEGDNLAPRPKVERRPSRQDLPSLQTKVPRDIPPQYRRSASGYGTTPTETDPNPQQFSRPPADYLLSPDVPRGKEYFGSAPRPAHQRTNSFGARPGSSSADKRKSGGSATGSSWTEPPPDKRSSGNFDKVRPRRNSNEKLTRPQELSEEYRRRDRHPSTHSARLSAGGSDREKSGRSSSRSNRRYQSDSESEFGDSGSEVGGHRRRHHRHRELQVEDGHRRSKSRSNRSSLDINSRQNTSPLPSPRGSPSRARERERAETFPQRSGSRSPIERPVSPFSPYDETPRPGDRLNPMDLPSRPRSRQSHSISTPTTTTSSSSRPSIVPIPIPVGKTPAEALRMPVTPSMEDNRAQSARPADPKPYWQPPAFQPPSNNLQMPVGSFRRYSEDVQKGIIPLPSCPRTNYVRGKNDWLTLPRCPGFDICPSCFTSSIAPTEFRDSFVRALTRDPKAEVICDFGSSPWYRIAWLLTRKMGRRDLGLFYDLAIIASTEPLCAGEKEAIRPWHSLVDPKTRNHISNFHVCYSCVKSVEVLLPPLTGLFRPLHPKRQMGDPRICDLRFKSKRFIQYFDTLETTADKSVQFDAPLDTRPLVSLCKRMAMFPECQRDTDLTEAYWNVITQLPEFTVCEECFDEVVWPELEDEKAIPMMFNKKLQKVSKASCQLYSPKMRGIFRTAVDGDDYKLLASKARERKAVEMQIKKDLDGWRRVERQGSPEAPGEIARIEEEWKKWE